MPAHAAGGRLNVTISKDPQGSKLAAPGVFSTRVLKASGGGSSLSRGPFRKSQNIGVAERPAANRAAAKVLKKGKRGPLGDRGNRAHENSIAPVFGKYIPG